MANVYVFNKKLIHSMSKQRDFYFLCIRDKDGYAADQIVNKETYDMFDPPCNADPIITVSNGKCYLGFVPVK